MTIYYFDCLVPLSKEREEYLQSTGCLIEVADYELEDVAIGDTTHIPQVHWKKIVRSPSWLHNLLALVLLQVYDPSGGAFNKDDVYSEENRALCKEKKYNLVKGNGEYHYKSSG